MPEVLENKRYIIVTHSNLYLANFFFQVYEKLEKRYYVLGLSAPGKHLLSVEKGKKNGGIVTAVFFDDDALNQQLLLFTAECGACCKVFVMSPACIDLFLDSRVVLC